jgi:hypothetical protein
LAVPVILRFFKLRNSTSDSNIKRTTPGPYISKKYTLPT